MIPISTEQSTCTCVARQLPNLGLSDASKGRCDQLPGAAPCTPYGLGLFALQLQFKLGGVRSCDQHGGIPHCMCRGPVPPQPGCPCLGDPRCPCAGEHDPGCFFAAPAWGHGGLDWGSGFPMSGHVPALNISFAVGANSGEGFPPGLNTSLLRSQNRAAYGAAMCAVMNATVQALLPGYPPFVGYDLGLGGGEQPGVCFGTPGFSPPPH